MHAPTLAEATVQVPGFHIEIPPVISAPAVSTDGYFGMRDWQGSCFGALKDSQHWIINAPMASGKSFEICALAANWLTLDPSLKVVIAVPQRIIAEGFHYRIRFNGAATDQLRKSTPGVLPMPSRSRLQWGRD